MITATATGHGDGKGTISLHDDETAVLTISLPSSANEGNGVLLGMGAITSSAAPARDVVVRLVCDDTTELTVPATVTLPAGQTTVSFDVTVVDDMLIDDAQTATVTASVENWTDGTASVNIIDNDRTLAVTLPVDAWEGEGTKVGVGTVQIGGTLPTDLTISLISSDAAEAVVAATVTILAGQTSAAFDVTIVDDTTCDSARPVTVAAGAPGFVNASAAMLVHDNEVDRFVWGTIDPSKTAGVAFGAAISAKNVDGETILVFSEIAAISARGDAGVLPVAPSSCAFAAGEWTGNITINAVDASVVLTVEGAGRASDSNVFDVIPGALASFRWSTVGSPQYENAPLSVVVTAQDANGFTVTDYNDTVEISGTVATGTASSIVVSEIEVGAVDRMEFTNVSGDALDIGGWKVLVYDSASLTTPREALTFPARTSCPAGGVFVVEEFGAAGGVYPLYHTGANLNWTPSATTGVAIVDTAGNVRDFVAASALNPGTITDPTAMTPNHWDGDQVAAVDGEMHSYQRVGIDDHDNASDWVTNRASSVGVSNAGLTMPFAGGDLAITPLTATLVNGVWTGSLVVRQSAADAYLRVDDTASAMSAKATHLTCSHRP